MLRVVRNPTHTFAAEALLNLLTSKQQQLQPCSHLRPHLARHNKPRPLPLSANQSTRSLHFNDAIDIEVAVRMTRAKLIWHGPPSATPKLQDKPQHKCSWTPLNLHALPQLFSCSSTAKLLKAPPLQTRTASHYQHCRASLKPGYHIKRPQPHSPDTAGQTQDKRCTLQLNATQNSTHITPSYFIAVAQLQCCPSAPPCTAPAEFSVVAAVGS